MDGLTVSTAESVLNQGDTVSNIRSKKLKNDIAGSGEEGKDFARTLSDAVNQVNDMKLEANKLQEQLATGETKNIPEVMIAAEKAGIAMKLMVQVRNKIIDAYHEVMKMQV